MYRGSSYATDQANSVVYGGNTVEFDDEVEDEPVDYVHANVAPADACENETNIASSDDEDDQPIFTEAEVNKMLRG